MHRLRDLNVKMDAPRCAVQAQRLLDLSDKVSEAGDLCVICSDLNVEPNSETQKINNGAGMVELVAHLGFESTRNSHYKKPGKFADYMFLNREVEVRGFRVPYEPKDSDHCPPMLNL